MFLSRSDSPWICGSRGGGGFGNGTEPTESGSDGEGWGPWSSNRSFDLTTCFEDSVLLNVPSVIFFLLAVPRLVVVLRRPAFHVPRDWTYTIKVTLPLLLASLWGSKLSALLIDKNSYNHEILAAASSAVAYAAAGCLHHIEQLRSAIGSTALLLFWLFQIIADIIIMRTEILLGRSPDFSGALPHSSTLLTAVTLILSSAVFVAENIPKDHHRYTLVPTSPEEAEAAAADEKLHDSPEAHANIFSRIWFLWMDPLMRLGYSKDLDMEDLWGLRHVDSAAANSNRFMRAWRDQVGRKKPSLFGAIAKSFGFTFASAAVFKVLQDMLSFSQPTFLKWILVFTASWSPENRGHEQPVSKGFAIAFMMLAAASFQTIFLHQYFHISITVGMRIRAALMTAVYQKALRLSNSARQNKTLGEIVNLMAVDAGRIGDMTQYLHIIWSGPFQISMAIYFLYQTLGPAIFAGVAVMILMIPVNAILATKSRALNKIQMGNKDSRTKLMDEVLSGIKIIKLYAWERPFLSKIGVIRDKEMHTLRRIGMLGAVQSFCWGSTPFLVSLFSFVVYSLVSSDPLTSPKVFVSLALFNLLQFPLNVFPSVISAIIDASVSLNRLRDFLSSEELDGSAVTKEHLSFHNGVNGSNGVAPEILAHPNQPIERISLQNGTFRWEEKSDLPTLKDVSISVSDGQLVGVVGIVGSGKSSTLSAILGEMYKQSGSVTVRGSIAYVPQTPWIMNATLKENILFGNAFDAEFYNATLEACGLKPDLSMLPGGDLTEIGERGINLSGGQKQRISLARAVYSRADIYLLDDTLSAVDAHVGRHIFDKVIGPRGLLRKRARLFVTHSIHHLPEFNYICMLVSGKIAECGTYQELMSRGDSSSVFCLVKEYGKRKDASAGDSEANLVEMGKTVSVGQLSKANSEKALSAPTKAVENAKSKLMSQEERSKGSVSLKVYATYAISCGVVSVFFFFVLATAGRFLSIAQDLYLADWADANDRKTTKLLRGLSLDDEPKDDAFHRLTVYGVIGFLGAFTMAGQVLYVWVLCGIRAARLLHNQMLTNVLHLPQSYFDTTPLGRILNRFSKDVYTVDEVLPRVFQGFVNTLLRVLSVLVVNAIGNWLFIFFVVPLGALYLFFQRYYLRTSRELKRLESTSRSPIYANFQETLNGVSTIRAYDQVQRFIVSNEDRVDYHLRAYYPSISSNRWLAVRLESIGTLLVFGSALFPVISIMVYGTVSASLVGLALTYSLSVTQTLNWVVRQSAEIETNIVSVERMKEYIDLPQEAAYEVPARRPSQSWPSNGEIDFVNYSTRYREGLELVLKDTSFKILPKEKIGIVGRTGAGKSSLTLALFRLIESASGKILIDGLDTSSLGLYDLRSRMTIIPQDSFLFTGTVRDNLDPFQENTDEKLWAALEAASLKPVIARLEGGLDAPVLQGGENFSVGQRQLICLARAVLRNTRILVLDEATAAIDYETDSIIQKTIRNVATNATVITIAHRINTIIDYDRILVLDAGRVVELDTPQALLKDKQSKFYSLAKEAGLAK
ncbi:hypothetical protein DFJ73DRAFT_811265 [Zopfochytrium polystomum]|nr:hypothetical protein DFJ73DRAFT_811265 [Zopfochytrium polystomum]